MSSVDTINERGLSPPRHVAPRPPTAATASGTQATGTQAIIPQTTGTQATSSQAVDLQAIVPLTTGTQALSPQATEVQETGGQAAPAPASPAEGNRLFCLYSV